MTNETVNIREFPALDKTLKGKKGAEITIGDLHGNSQKLMYFLVRHGVLKISAADYKAFDKIYQKDVADLSAKDITQFKNIINGAKVDPSLTLRLIGDELADRGSNDYFTLAILNKLAKNKCNYEILVSNHGLEFLDALESKDPHFTAKLMAFEHTKSMANLQFLVDNKLISRKEVLEMANKAYKPFLKPITYTLEANEITIHTHAGIGIENIRAMAKRMGVTYSDGSAKNLAKTIDSINKKFAAHIKQNNVTKRLYNREALQRGYNGEAIDLLKNPFEHAIWNRTYTNISRPHKYKGYKINWAHGHDLYVPMEDHIFNLDNLLGKLSIFNKGIYNVMYNHSSLKKKNNNSNDGNQLSFKLALAFVLPLILSAHAYFYQNNAMMASLANTFNFLASYGPMVPIYASFATLALATTIAVFLIISVINYIDRNQNTKSTNQQADSNEHRKKPLVFEKQKGYRPSQGVRAASTRVDDSLEIDSPRNRRRAIAV